VDSLEKFAVWFLAAIVGNWFIWGSFMAIKFMTEDAQGQKAAFSVLHNTQVGGFIVIPILLSILYTIVSAIFIAGEM